MEKDLSFEECARRLSAAFAVDGSQPHSEDRDRVRSSLLTILVARFHALGVTELYEVADEAMTRLLKESRRQGNALDSASGWLVRTATRLALDQFKTPRRESLDDSDAAIEDEFTARLIERLESDDQVSRGLRHAVEAGDEVAVQVVGDYLDLADEMTGFPSSRAVAQRCPYSHTTVQEALSRFRQYVE